MISASKMQGNYPVITIFGSTRFKGEFYATQKKLTLEGNIVISVGLFGEIEKMNCLILIKNRE